ncbi:MAG: type II toxin-antitoxin system prevent-host-death family antitoxin [Verrucomicrobiota bacterium]
MKIQDIGAFEAKTKLSELLEKVQHGQTFQITKRGKPVAVLSPVQEIEGKKTSEEPSFSEIFAKIRKHSKPGPGIKELVHMGHKY